MFLSSIFSRFTYNACNFNFLSGIFQLFSKTDLIEKLYITRDASVLCCLPP